MKRAHWIQHVPFEGLGQIEPWLIDHGYTISCTRQWADDALPALDELRSIDLLIIMGGPMSVNDEDAYPWLVAEKDLVRHAVSIDQPTLGICLGAQMIAAAAGSLVYPGPYKEIGWFKIEGQGSGSGNELFPPEATVFHWHGETFDLPDGARLLASSEGCLNQAFQLGSSVIGLQFHLEMNADTITTICQECADDLDAGTYVQTPEKMQDLSNVYVDPCEKLLDSILRSIS